MLLKRPFSKVLTVSSVRIYVRFCMPNISCIKCNNLIPSRSISAPEEVVGPSVPGIVRTFNTYKGFGFIVPTNTGGDALVHYTDILKPNPQHPRATLRPGENVIFDLFKQKGKLRARNVTGPRGAAVLGSVIYDVPHNFKLTRDIVASIFERRVKGIVKRYNVDSKSGFISRWNTDAEVYVASCGILKQNPNHVYRSLCPGEEVEFDIAMYNEVPLAINVTGPGNTCVKGSLNVEGPRGYFQLYHHQRAVKPTRE